MAFAGIEARILTGMAPYDQCRPIEVDGRRAETGCAATAALMLLAYYRARHGWHQLLSSEDEPQAMPESVAGELRRRMHTLDDALDGRPWPITLPAFFHAGLEGYIRERYPFARVKEYTTEAFGRGLGALFAHARELVDDGVPAVLLFDWQAPGTVLPHLYTAVVGYRIDGARRHLIVNPGWGPGTQFLTVDCDDRRLRPAVLYYIEPADEIAARSGAAEPMGPPTGYRWLRAGGDRRLRPLVRRHFSTSVETWPPSRPARELVAGTDYTVCDWR